ncbi:hypothetical protein BDP27DRAFT_1374532 [Rhodocollybia butyracea]|uniref:Uncharacterized protein n=1 Tax=Rhodocollybia butyracea TaxID=206335 RepID=A0A9P5P4M8_9AGAR|nr:hypothetical protein BDP27DRAFT_1374532 [Rhodocollybia butyracea]
MSDFGFGLKISITFQHEMAIDPPLEKEWTKEPPRLQRQRVNVSKFERLNPDCILIPLPTYHLVFSSSTRELVAMDLEDQTAKSSSYALGELRSSRITRKLLAKFFVKNAADPLPKSHLHRRRPAIPKSHCSISLYDTFMGSFVFTTFFVFHSVIHAINSYCRKYDHERI